MSSEALVDDLFSRGNPNPERIGCPARDVLVALARKERAIGDPAYDTSVSVRRAGSRFVS